MKVFSDEFTERLNEISRKMLLLQEIKEFLFDISEWNYPLCEKLDMALTKFSELGFPEFDIEYGDKIADMLQSPDCYFSAPILDCIQIDFLNEKD